MPEHPIVPGFEKKRQEQQIAVASLYWTWQMAAENLELASSRTLSNQKSNRKDDNSWSRSAKYIIIIGV
jgi:hypothetical protein